MALISRFPIIKLFTHCLVYDERTFSVARRWCGVLCCLIAAAGCNGGNPAKGAARYAEPSSNMHSLLVAEPSRIDLGEISRGGQKQAGFSLTNPGTQAIELVRIESTCPCLTIDVPRRLAPGEQVTGRAKVDLRDEPHFTGEASVTVKGWTRAGELAFAVVVEVKVPRRSER